MNARTKIKVNRQVLIAAIEEKRETARGEHAARVKQYSKQIVLARKAKASAFRKIAAEVAQKLDKGEEVRLKGWGDSAFDDLPDLPDDPGEFRSARYDRSIAQLRMSVDDTISISVEDFERYIG